MPKNIEFSDTEIIPWKKLGKGTYEKVLNRNRQTGSYTRLLKFEPGGETKKASSHEFSEEVIIIKGSLLDKSLNMVFTEGMYAFRNPRMKHGPYVSPSGCITFEIGYFEGANSAQARLSGHGKRIRKFA